MFALSITQYYAALYETPDNENTTKMPDDKQTVQISL